MTGLWSAKPQMVNITPATMGAKEENYLIHEGEQGAHQTGDILAGTVDLVVGAVGGHGDNDVAGQTLEASGKDGQADVQLTRK